MTEGQRLVVLTSADSQDLTAPLLDSLAEWCRAGLLGHVVWSSALDLSRGGYEAPCWHSAVGEWTQATLGEVMSALPLSEVWLAALRHPQGPGRPDAIGQVRREEENAHEAVSGLLGPGASFVSMTVGVASAGARPGIADCSPLWSFHLVHGPKSEAHERAPKVAAADHSPLGLCALVALCASGGWRGAQSGIGLTPDRADGPFKPVRFVHCQVRILHTPSAARIARPSSMPASPPWPLPNAAGVKRALPDALPPASMANQLALACGFRCNQSPRLPGTADEFVLTQLWRGLFRSLPAPAPNSKHEDALRRLANRTGGLADNEDSRGMTRLALEGADEPVALVSHLQRSDFPLPGGSAGAARSTPVAWQTLREAMFGLVDGTTLPGGVPAPHEGERGDAVRLVWTDPAGIAPEWAPADASDVLLGSNTPMEDAPKGSEEGEATEVENPDTDAGEPRQDESESDPAAAVRWSTSSLYDSGNSEEPGRVHAGGGYGDTLMARLGETLHQAVRLAQRGFRDHAALRSVGSEYEGAVTAQKWARRLLMLLGIALAVIAVFALDHWWPFLAAAWEFVTPFDARRLYHPAMWHFALFGGITLAVGLTLFCFLASRLLDNLRRLEEGNALRRRFGENASHFASEVLRLRSMAEQFADHRLIVTEFLYRPFGVPQRAENTTLSTAELQFGNEPPPSMLVARAEAASERVDTLHQQRQTSSMDQGWLVRIFGDAMAVWREHYQWRIVGGAEDPDSDTSPPGSVIHRDRHDGSDVYGARTDFVQSVVGNQGEAVGGWVVRKAAEKQFGRLITDIEGGVAAYLGLLSSIAPVHGAPAGIGHDALLFMELGNRRHWFDWNAVLAPGADTPRVDPVGTTGEPWLVSDVPEDRSVVVAWHMDISGPVRPQDLKGWQMASDETDPEGPKRMVV
ncbi:MAG: hypothetical protein KTV68_14705 [Acidimicrobiia bacterium]|nr:hypothetical protein [Acidimicrobiia bacterium]